MAKFEAYRGRNRVKLILQEELYGVVERRCIYTPTDDDMRDLGWVPLERTEHLQQLVKELERRVVSAETERDQAIRRLSEVTTERLERRDRLREERDELEARLRAARFDRDAVIRDSSKCERDRIVARLREWASVGRIDLYEMASELERGEHWGEP